MSEKRGAKITWEIAEEIRRLRNRENLTYNLITQRIFDFYGIQITYQTVGKVINREIWREP